ncbi:hypothetical protein ES703_12202 [subsurface metagenome]
MKLKQGKEDSTAIKVIKGVVTVLFMLALLFVPAGTLRLLSPCSRSSIMVRSWLTTKSAGKDSRIS